MRDARHTVGHTAGIRAHAVAEQVAVVVPGIGHAPQVGQPVGVVASVDGRVRNRCLRQPGAHRVVGVLVEPAIEGLAVCLAWHYVVSNKLCELNTFIPKGSIGAEKAMHADHLTQNLCPNMKAYI